MRQHKPTIPWLLVTAVAAVYWTIALGLGVPSFERLLGDDEPRPLPDGDARCVSALVDGRPVAFGDCINVRFVLDSPEIPRPPAAWRRGEGLHPGPHAGPDPEMLAPVWRPTSHETAPVGSTRY